MLRAFVQVCDSGMPFNANAYAAYDGFRERGVGTDFFRPNDAALWSTLEHQADDLVFAARMGRGEKRVQRDGIRVGGDIRCKKVAYRCIGHLTQHV